MVMLGDKVEFYFRRADPPKNDRILKGKVTEKAKSGGYIIKVVDDESMYSEKSMNGTLCNRSESEIIKVI